jgi:hypothetical protein
MEGVEGDKEERNGNALRTQTEKFALGSHARFVLSPSVLSHSHVSPFTSTSEQGKGRGKV